MMFEIIIYQKTSLPPAAAMQVQEIYESSFPAAEREPFTSLLDGVEQGSSWLTCGLLDGKIIGFGVVTPLSRASIFFLGYIAIQQADQGKGLGSKLLEAILEASIRAHAAGILLEVEDPGDVESVGEREKRLKRIQYYKKNGGALIDDGGIYRMPNLTGPGSLAMRLMWIPGDTQIDPGVPMALRDLLILVYSEIYGRTKVDALLVQSVLARLP